MTAIKPRAAQPPKLEASSANLLGHARRPVSGHSNRALECRRLVRGRPGRAHRRHRDRRVRARLAARFDARFGWSELFGTLLRHARERLALVQACGDASVEHARARVRATRAGRARAGEALLAAAMHAAADLLVMRAYGRSRVDEWAFGGATRTVLRDARIPVFLHL